MAVRRARTRAFEQLEQRALLTSAWFNMDLACDVDASGRVAALDVLLIVNELNAGGSRSLPAENANAAPPYWDVSNDNLLSPLDALLVINALNRALPDVPGLLRVDAADDPNGNGVVLVDGVRLLGQTSAYARVTLTSDRVENWPEGFASTVWVGPSGLFSYDVPLKQGVNEFTLEIRDELGRTKSLQREVRRGDLITDWNAAALNVVRDWSTYSNDPYENRIVTARPPEVARNLAMIHSAMFDAINAVSGEYEPYFYTGTASPGTSAIAAGAAAAYEVAAAIYSQSDELAVWEATLAEVLGTIPDDASRALGVELGTAVGQAMLQLRQNDGSNAPEVYAPGSGPGAWQRTLPDHIPPLLPQWPGVTPFVISSAEDYRVAPPPALASQEYAEAVDEVLRLGALNSSERTADQTEIAVFWADGGGTATPPGHWNRIAADIVDAQALSLVDSARTMALLNLALADAGIASWDSKYAYDLWRPIDAIRLADTDGNSATEADASWLPLLRTPPFPTYTSGHSTFSAAAAAVLTGLFGDNYAFQSTSDAHSAPGQRPLDESLIVTRAFSNFRHAAEEAGLSRIYGGIHFSFDNTAGLDAGEAVGAFVVQTALRPKA